MEFNQRRVANRYFEEQPDPLDRRREISILLLNRLVDFQPVIMAFFHLGVCLLCFYYSLSSHSFVVEQLSLESPSQKRVPGDCMYILVVAGVIQSIYFGIAFLNDCFGTNSYDEGRAGFLQKARDFLFSLAFPFGLYGGFESLVALGNLSNEEDLCLYRIKLYQYFFNLNRVACHLVEVGQPRTFSMGIVQQGMIYFSLMGSWAFLIAPKCGPFSNNAGPIQTILPVMAAEAKILLWFYRNQKEFSKEIHFYVEKLGNLLLPPLLWLLAWLILQWKAFFAFFVFLCMFKCMF